MINNEADPSSTSEDIELQMQTTYHDRPNSAVIRACLESVRDLLLLRTSNDRLNRSDPVAHAAAMCTEEYRAHSVKVMAGLDAAADPAEVYVVMITGAIAAAKNREALGVMPVETASSQELADYGAVATREYNRVERTAGDARPTKK